MPGRIANVRQRATIGLGGFLLVFQRKAPQRASYLRVHRQSRLSGANPRHLGNVVRIFHVARLSDLASVSACGPTYPY